MYFPLSRAIKMKDEKNFVPFSIVGVFQQGSSESLLVICNKKE